MFCKVSCCRFNSTHVTGGHKCGTCGQYGHGQIECRNSELKQNLKEFERDKLPDYLQCKISNCKFKWSHTVSAHHCSNCNGREHSKDNCPKAAMNVNCPICKTTNKVSREILNNTQQFASDTDCCVCMVNIANVYFQSCNHVCICSTCCQKLGTLPSRINISQHIIPFDNLPEYVRNTSTQIFNASDIVNPYTRLYGGMGCIWFIRKNQGVIEGFFLHSDNQGQYGPETDHTPMLNVFLQDYNLVNPNVDYSVD